MNFKFLLKKTGYSKILESNKFQNTNIAIFTILFYFFYFSSNEEFLLGVELIMLLISFFFSAFFTFLIVATIKDIIGFIRKKIPSSVDIIEEEGKKYTVKHFSTLGITKYYYDNLLHREVDAAVINKNYFGNKYFLFGKEVNKKDIEKEIIKNKIFNFN